MIELDKKMLKKNLDYAHRWDAAIESRGDSPLSDARVFLAIAIKLIEEKLVGGYEDWIPIKMRPGTDEEYEEFSDATERRNDTTALERVIEIMQNERKCVLRQDTSECDRDCANCELVLPKEDVNAAYDYVLTILHAVKLGYEIGGQIKLGGDNT